MAIFPSPTQDWRRSLTRAGRWVILLAASVLLHLTVFQWANGRIGMPSAGKETPVVIAAQLYTPPPPPKPRPRPKPKLRPKPVAPKPVPAPPARPAIAPVVETVPASDIATADLIAAAVDDAAGTEELFPLEPAVDFTQAEEAEAPRYTVSPPPSAELSYDVSAVREQQNWYGSGVFRWESTNDAYRIAGEASVRIIFKFNVLNFSSEGRINDFGIAPLLYTEQSRRKPLTETRFQHDEGKVVFSASAASHPYQGGEQDRASIMWQLAGIGRGDPSQFQPGTTFDIAVAGARDADIWHIAVVGEEEIDTPYGSFATWHVVRAPRAGSNEQQIDIWLAKQHEWYPVKVLYTDANGDHLDMSLSDLKPIQPHSTTTENP